MHRKNVNAKIHCFINSIARTFESSDLKSILNIIHVKKIIKFC